ncbi:Uncharacterized protein HZ326_3222 [Fusarium oxysporum f. sp. albedinis]|nr:Uncharacterized protein HZ326_3222 [Fusarium oxysporum f. sp. albedinis]
MVPSTWLWVSMGDGHGMAWFLIVRYIAMLYGRLQNNLISFGSQWSFVVRPNRFRQDLAFWGIAPCPAAG